MRDRRPMRPSASSERFLKKKIKKLTGLAILMKNRGVARPWLGFLGLRLRVEKRPEPRKKN